VSNSPHNHAEFPMVKIPAGEIELRDDRIKTTWTSQVCSFLLAPVPVTKELYYSILQEPVGPNDDLPAPVVDVSWNDAILFCNLLSRHSGLQECYSVSNDGESVDCNWEAEMSGSGVGIYTL
jgi:hypothetical protein